MLRSFMLLLATSCSILLAAPAPARADACAPPPKDCQQEGDLCTAESGKVGACVLESTDPILDACLVCKEGGAGGAGGDGGGSSGGGCAVVHRPGPPPWLGALLSFAAFGALRRARRDRRPRSRRSHRSC